MKAGALGWVVAGLLAVTGAAALLALTQPAFPFAGVAGAVLLPSTALAARAWLRLRAQERLAAAAQQLGLVMRAPGPRWHSCAGRIDGMPVEVQVGPGVSEDLFRATRYLVGSIGAPAGLRVDVEDMVSRARGIMLGNRDLQSADAPFDAAVLLDGATVETVAVLDHATRERLLQFVAQEGGRVADGVLEQTAIGTPAAGAIVRQVRALVDLARCLSLKDRSVPPLLLANATQDPVPGVRGRNLELLIGSFPHSAEAHEACRFAILHTDSVPILLLAAEHLGAEAWPGLQEVCARGLAPEELRVAALKRLVTGAPHASQVPTFLALLGEKSPRLWRPAVEGLGVLRHAPAFDAIVARLPGADGTSAAVIAESLERIADARAETPLIGLLQHPDPRARAAAAVALGNLGTVRAVEPLLACARSSSFLGGGDLRRYVEAAVRAIQSRLGDVGRGRLSLAEEQGPQGALSLAGSQGTGGLSLADASDRPDVPTAAAGAAVPPPRREGEQSHA